MSNYFDNQKRWSWTCDGKSVKVETDHGDHSHRVDVTNLPIGSLYDTPGRTMGDAHRATTHDKK